MTKIKYYLIKTMYVGANCGDIERHQDREGYMTIETRPGQTNMSHEERTNGWLGETNGWSAYACGEYDTVEEAAAEVTKRGYTELTANRNECDDTVIQTYTTKSGTMDTWTVKDWLYNSLDQLITVKTTDEEIVKIAAELELEALTDNVYLDDEVARYLIAYRKELREAEE